MFYRAITVVSLFSYSWVLRGITVLSGHPYEPLLAVSGIDHTIKIFSPDSRAQMDARRGIDMRKNFASSSGTSRLDGWPRSRRQVRNVPSGEELSTAAHSSVETGSELPLNGGLSSRKRMYDSEKIISQNDEDRKAGSRDAYITVCCWPLMYFARCHCFQFCVASVIAQFNMYVVSGQ